MSPSSRLIRLGPSHALETPVRSVYRYGMSIEKECPCCKKIYTILIPIFDESPDLDEDEDDETEEDSNEPQFCPFCGKHESEEAEEEDK